jgi:hypothetical protein
VTLNYPSSPFWGQLCLPRGCVTPQGMVLGYPQATGGCDRCLNLWAQGLHQLGRRKEQRLPKAGSQSEPWEDLGPCIKGSVSSLEFLVSDGNSQTLRGGALWGSLQITGSIQFKEIVESHFFFLSLFFASWPCSEGFHSAKCKAKRPINHGVVIFVRQK